MMNVPKLLAGRKSAVRGLGAAFFFFWGTTAGLSVAMEQVFVDNGQAAKLRTTGEATMVQNADAVECHGEGLLTPDGLALGDGDFLVRATLRLRKFAHTAATFQLGGSHIGFDGENKCLFISGGWFGSPATNLDVENVWAVDGEWFDFEAARRTGRLEVRLNDVPILTRQVGSGAVGFFGIRPWRATVDVRDFQVEGRLVPVRILSRDAETCCVFSNGLGGYPHFRIPSLVTTRNGVVLALAEGRGLQRGTHGDISGNHRKAHLRGFALE